jgi:hypothetical protein
MATAKSSFTCKDEPIENLRPLKARVIGAGYSVICLGFRISQRLGNIDFQIFEKNDAVCGAWYENKYPGCAVIGRRSGEGIKGCHCTESRGWFDVVSAVGGYVGEGIGIQGRGVRGYGAGGDRGS